KGDGGGGGNGGSGNGKEKDKNEPEKKKPCPDFAKNFFGNRELANAFNDISARTNTDVNYIAAVSALESDWFRSASAIANNNPFGIGVEGRGNTFTYTPFASIQA
ncbi:MAG: glucosaminidase domain-containing protein, partial [Chthoniobacterales bacterium]